jgi:hypothetical protein
MQWHSSLNSTLGRIYWDLLDGLIRSIEKQAISDHREFKSSELGSDDR